MESAIYHVMTKSIAGFKIFNTKNEFIRVINLLKFYQKEKMPVSFYRFNEFLKGETKQFRKKVNLTKDNNIIKIISYCIMPTHLHLILQEIKEKTISNFMSKLLNSYTKYFNIKHDRKGPLWESRFKKVLIQDDEQLLHVTRYIHLNPVTAKFVENPKQWEWSSYHEFLGTVNQQDRICQYEDVIDLQADSYEEFVKERISYQRKLSFLKKSFLE